MLRRKDRRAGNLAASRDSTQPSDSSHPAPPPRATAVAAARKTDLL